MRKWIIRLIAYTAFVFAAWCFLPNITHPPPRDPRLYLARENGLTNVYLYDMQVFLNSKKRKGACHNTGEIYPVVPSGCVSHGSQEPFYQFAVFPGYLDFDNDLTVFLFVGTNKDKRFDAKTIEFIRGFRTRSAKNNLAMLLTDMRSENDSLYICLWDRKLGMDYDKAILCGMDESTTEIPPRLMELAGLTSSCAAEK